MSFANTFIAQLRPHQLRSLFELKRRLTIENQRPCPICGSLHTEEYAMQKYGWPQDDTYLPPAAGQLTIVRDFRPHDSRQLQLRQCPECQTYYLYQTDYEFLAGGSEDEEFLTRLTPEQAQEYLNRPIK